MKCTLFSFILITFCVVVNGQNDFNYYDQLTKHADTLFYQSKYQEAINEYKTAISLNNNLGKVKHRYNIACAYSELNKIDSSFQELFYIAEKGHFSSFEKLDKEKSLEKLHSNDLWNKLVAIVLNNRNLKIENKSSQ